MNNKGLTLLGWAITFLVIALIAGLFGFGFISGVSITIAKWLAILFVVLFVISIISHYMQDNAMPHRRNR